MVLKRPIITILVLYIFVIIILDYLGVFLARNQSSLIYNINQKNVTITGKVLEQPIIKNNNQQFVLEVSNINDITIKEKVLVYAQLAYNIEYGDIICISGRLSNIEKPSFPYNFDYNLYLQRQKIYTKFYLYSFELIDKQPNKIKLLSLKVNKDIENKIAYFFKQPYSLILQSMFIGNQYFPDKEIKNAFVNTGLIHILVVSGWNIGFCVVICICILKLFCLPLKYIYLLTIPTIFFYALMTGANPPATRAAIMASCMLLSLTLDREPLIYNAIALSALIIFIFNPQTLFTSSCQLSFIATLGIIYLYPKINSMFGNIKNKIYKFIWEIVSVTVSAQIALIPILMFYFGQLSIISLAVNILIVPVVGFVVGLSFLFYFTTFLSSYITLGISVVLSLILNLMLKIIHFFSNLQFSMIDVKVPAIIEIFFYYFAIIIMIEFGKSKKILAILSFVIILMLVVPLEKQEFCKTFNNGENITIHIKNKLNGNIIVFEKINKDKYYFSNLQQYLLAQGITTIDKFYLRNSTDIQKNVPKIKIKEIFDIKEIS